MGKDRGMRVHEPSDTFEASCRRLGVAMIPDGTALEAEGVLNPGVTRDRHGRLLVFPRIVARGNVSRIGIARVTGSSLERLGVVLNPEAEYEKRGGPAGHGCEDARVTFVAELDRYVMMYTAFGPQGARIAIGISADGYEWERLGLVRFADDALNAVDNKDAAFFPEPVLSPAGIRSYAFFHRPMRPETINGQTPIPIILALPNDQREAMCIAYMPVESVHANIANLCVATESRRIVEVGDTWGRLKNGAGTPPVRTRFGWLSVFHAVDAVESAEGAALLYSAGVLINDLETPHHVVYRSSEPILTPETTAERFGTVNNVVFPTGIDRLSESVFDIYYGAADAKISRARLETA
ncbi:MAG: hypothetical protein NVSMB64_11650 [Candidatus Velthaea sp.]